MIVIDASAMIELILGHSLGDEADALLAEGVQLAAPQLLQAEVLNALRKALLAKSLSKVTADLAVLDFSRLEISYFDAAPFVMDVWKMRDNFTSYDASYLVLAVRLSVPLLTRDKRFASQAANFIRLL
jgi:predicted nucleic acid-binding protein